MAVDVSQLMLLLVGLLAGLQRAKEGASPPRYRCRYCRADLGGLTDQGAGLVHPGNNCRHGKRGFCAAPFESIEATGEDFVFDESGA